MNFKKSEIKKYKKELANLGYEFAFCGWSGESGISLSGECYDEKSGKIAFDYWCEFSQRQIPLELEKWASDKGMFWEPENSAVITLTR